MYLLMYVATRVNDPPDTTIRKHDDTNADHNALTRKTIVVLTPGIHIRRDYHEVGCAPPLYTCIVSKCFTKHGWLFPVHVYFTLYRPPEHHDVTKSIDSVPLVATEEQSRLLNGINNAVDITYRSGSIILAEY